MGISFFLSFRDRDRDSGCDGKKERRERKVKGGRGV